MKRLPYFSRYLQRTSGVLMIRVGGRSPAARSANHARSDAAVPTGIRAAAVADPGSPLARCMRKILECTTLAAEKAERGRQTLSASIQLQGGRKLTPRDRYAERAEDTKEDRDMRRTERTGLASCFFRGTAGASMAEAAITLPIFLLVALGVADFGLLLWNFNSAHKATHWGARAAVVKNPVAVGLNDLSNYWAVAPASDHLGQSCTLSDGTFNTHCPTTALDTDCTATSLTSGSCTNGWTFSSTAFQEIFQEAARVYPDLQPHQVMVSYRHTGLGFVGRPGGLPMQIRVRLCRTHEFIVLGSLAGLIGSGGCGSSRGWPIISAATFTSEDLRS